MIDAQETRTVRLQLESGRFCYQFVVEIPLEIEPEEVCDLEATNSAGERFSLAGLGNITMCILRLLGHATKSNTEEGDEMWKLLSVPNGRRLGVMARFAPAAIISNPEGFGETHVVASTLPKVATE